MGTDTMIARAFAIGVALVLSHAPVTAQTQQTGFNRPTQELRRPNAQLVRGVQYNLDFLRFEHVDARTLTNRQIAALHLEFQGRAVSFGRKFFRTRQTVKVILGWDAPLPLPEDVQ